MGASGYTEKGLSSSPPNGAQSTDEDIPRSPDNDLPEVEYPDGGFDAWMQVLAGFLAQGLAWGYPPTFGIYQLYYTETLGLPNTDVAWIGSLGTALTFFMSAFSGTLADAGYAKACVGAGSFLAVFGMFMTSLATQYWQILLAQGLCVGIGMGLLFSPALAVASTYFQAKRALALSITSTGSAFGAVVFAAILQYSIPAIGFPWAVRTLAFVTLLFGVVLTLALKPRPGVVKSGRPLIDLSAFREKSYILAILTCLFNFWAMFLVTTYVSASNYPV